MLKGKTAVITGCLQGIGRATLDAFAKNGASVFACCLKETPENTTHINKLMEQYGVEIIPVYFDLSDHDQVKQAAMLIHRSKKPVSILVNIAGMTDDAIFHMLKAEQIDRVMDINFVSHMIFTQYITKIMLRQAGGSVINMSSTSALDGNYGQLAYASAKAAVAAATRVLSIELGHKNIRVNAVAPGVIDTDMNAIVPNVVKQEKIRSTDLGRIGKPEEVASTIVYLASDKSSYITGQVLRVDGGLGD